MKNQLLLGTYTDRVSEGIYTIDLNTETQELENLSLLAEVGSPSYLDTNEDKTIIYAIVSENDDGGVVSLVQQEDGSYERKETALVEGTAPAYLSLDERRQFVYTANYDNGEVSVYKTDEEGNLELTDTVEHSGSSVREEQEASHAHYAHVTPDGRYMIVCDLGTDKVYTYEVSDKGKLSEVATLEVEPGTGPRHLTFHPIFNKAYLFGELSSEVLVLDYDFHSGEFEVVQTLSSIPSDHTSFNSGAAIRISRDGRFVYASNRGHNSIVTYKVDEEEDGKLDRIGYTSTEGNFPRDFNLNQSEDYLIVGHQHSDNLTLFERDKEDGSLTLLQKDVEAPQVICIAHF